MIFNTGASNNNLTVDTTNLSEDFSLNALLQLLAEKYYPKHISIPFVENGVVNSDYPMELVSTNSAATNQYAYNNYWIVEKKSGVEGYALLVYELDLTNFANITFKGYTTFESTRYGVFGVRDANNTTWEKKIDVKSSTLSTYTLDVSNLSGKYLVVVGAYGTADQGATMFINNFLIE